MRWYEFWKLPPKKEEPDPYIIELEEKGFRYNEVDAQWQRVWATVTKTGTETVLEVRKKEKDGWKYIMYGDNDNVFYEYNLNT